MEKQVKSRLGAVAAAAVALMCAVTTARADITGSAPSAYAESQMKISNFGLFVGGTSTPLGSLVGTAIQGLEANVSTTASALINNVGPAAVGANIDPLAPGSPQFSIQTSAGPNAANYSPFTSYTLGTLGTGVFAGAASTHIGNGLQLNGEPTTTANTQAQVNINGANSEGKASSGQLLSSTFLLTVAAPPVGPGGILVDAIFDAQTFIRRALGQPDVSAGAGRAWSLTVTNRSTLEELLVWAPNGSVNTAGLSGTCVGLGACTELYDAFSLNFSTSTLNISDAEQSRNSATDGDPNSGFGLRLFLANGDYEITINHETRADANALIPEPGSLALFGAAMLGLASVRRRLKKV